MRVAPSKEPTDEECCAGMTPTLCTGGSSGQQQTFVQQQAFLSDVPVLRCYTIGTRQQEKDLGGNVFNWYASPIAQARCIG
jgi:hypothetical protein